MVQRLQDGVGPSWADQVGNTVHPTTMWSQRLEGGYPGHTIELPATTADINLCATHALHRRACSSDHSQHDPLLPVHSLPLAVPPSYLPTTDCQQIAFDLTASLCPPCSQTVLGIVVRAA